MLDAPPPTPSGEARPPRHAPQDRQAPHLEIHVNQDILCLRGTGVDVNPSLLSGNVVLHLSEPTSIKEITLQFRGKARLPASAAEPLALSTSQLTFVVCNHEWSFLEGDRHHAHTLKAGRHLFPFQLQIGGSLPSTIYTSAMGGASVQYKLRAQLVRGGFGLTHRDITALQPITIMRGYGTEALEYQQTLEIENTWPEKLMYSIMIPHKAWAAGERLTAIVKFQPLVKGARVLAVTTTINETVKLWSRAGCQDNTRVIASTKHDIVDGKAVCVQEQHHRFRVPILGGSSTSRVSTPAQTPGHAHSHSTGSYFPPVASSSSHSTFHSPAHPPAELPSLTRAHTRTSSNGPSVGTSTAGSTADLQSQPFTSPSDDLLMDPANDVVTSLNVTVPLHATPSHSLEPIQVTHRVRWSILISNLDGHTSELRCSLPIHVLDHRLAEEARVATLATRRLLLGAGDVDGGEAVLGDEDADADALPSYPSHVRDRVANAYLPDAATMRVANAWVVNGMSPTIAADRAGAHSGSSSGIESPAVFETWQVGPGMTRPLHSEHLPHEPQPGAHPLEWVNTELLLSLGREAPEAPAVVTQRATPPSRTPPESAHASRHGSRFPSRRGSRANSRAGSRSGSPERTPPESEHGASAPPPSVPAGTTFVHGQSTASRHTNGLFHIAMKPFSSLGSTFTLGSRSGSHANLQALAAAVAHGHPAGASGASTPAEAAPVPMTSQEMLHHAFTQVPDYDMASRGFLGGGITPLESVRDLPTYESAVAGGARSFSDGDLAGMFAAHGARPSSVPPRSGVARSSTSTR
ncbi:uncharacterized protein BXZ73DRAFT_97805 [Epithele typhae]|uniref:uncharacterized protein n=1 Tax=Epithele typhae TaxID=378194 RepID=UPI002007899C|nr:uncharacterized protein BXZ73DRAFT_97805 [Epithele typhae]KAH9942393.1 hypothetical protein BXZ73DRAFT_97805 [Epithele typhae]